jgi:hypothetical protein
MGKVELKGIPEPVEAFELHDEHVDESRFEALRAARLTPLIGRQEEVELLLRRWRQAHEGMGALC